MLVMLQQPHKESMKTIHAKYSHKVDDNPCCFNHYIGVQYQILPDFKSSHSFFNDIARFSMRWPLPPSLHLSHSPQRASSRLLSNFITSLKFNLFCFQVLFQWWIFTGATPQNSAKISEFMCFAYFFETSAELLSA